MKANDILKVVNEVASLGIFLNITAFYIMVFGKVGKIQERPIWEQYFVRVGLLTIATGSLLNIVAEKAPPFNEVIVNVGLSILFVWAAMFHYHVFVKPKK